MSGLAEAPPEAAPPLTLHWSPKSPFVRKVMIAAHELGVAERIRLVRTVAVMTRPNPTLMADNPLNKIPTLVLPDGQALYDSLTICEYLDGLAATPRLFPVAGPERWTALTRHALGNGLLDVLILWRNEREKPAAAQTAAWLEAFALKYRAGMGVLEGLVPWLDATPFGIAHIAIGCALGYLDFRFEALGWRAGHARLAAWHADFCRRPSAMATEVVDG